MATNKMTAARLIAAIAIISVKDPFKTIVSIEFEDGSGKKFNVKFKEEPKPVFIDLSNEKALE